MGGGGENRYSMVGLRRDLCGRGGVGAVVVMVAGENRYRKVGYSRDLKSREQVILTPSSLYRRHGYGKVDRVRKSMARKEPGELRGRGQDSLPHTQSYIYIHPSHPLPRTWIEQDRRREEGKSRDKRLG